MNLKNTLLRALPYITAIVVFWVVSAAYFAPQLGGETLGQTDVQMYEGMKKDISDHRAAFDEDPQWTGGMFGGMPAYLITVQYPAMVLRNAAQWTLNLLGEPVSLMFLAMLGFWLMLLMAGVNPWVAIVPALAYGLSTYNILIIGAGHITKMRAMGYAPMLVGAVILTLRGASGSGGRENGCEQGRGRIWIGGSLAALFGTLTIAASHHQITYYFLLVVVACWLNGLVVTAREKTRTAWARFGKATAVLLGAGVLAVGANFTHLWYTAQHTPDTTRGGSELAENNTTDARGLDLEYATAWSYGIGESVNMFIPDFRGGSSTQGFEADGEVAGTLRRSGISPSVATQLPGYWGTQPFTGGPTYLGAVTVLLAVLGMFVLPGRKKWWVLGASVLCLLLAWGHNAMWFTELAFNILPGYNKFRTVSMALVVLQWAVPFLAALTMAGLLTGELFSTPADRRRLLRGLWWSLGITGGVALLFALFGGMIHDFSAAGDSQFSQVPGLVEAMQRERLGMFRADCWRSLVLVVLTAAAVWAVVSWRGARRWMFVVAIGVLTLADLVPVDLRYLSHDDFHDRAQVGITPDEADLSILADTELGYRVLNADNPFNDAATSYFHRSVGGYHGAKLRRYQDVIDRYLSKWDQGVLDMLDTKYIIFTDRETGRRTVELNPTANGAAWFVKDLIHVHGPREELDALGSIDTKTEATTDFDTPYTAGSGEGEIRLVEYRPNYLKYTTSSIEDQVAVFSEIYYDKGWTAYIDGTPAPYFRADYILRAMPVPAGDHVVEWKFRAPGFAKVEGVTLAASIAIIIWLILSILLCLTKKKG